MPRSIIDIEIDPSGAFKRFAETFEKYKEAAADLPDVLKDSSDVATALFAGFAGMTAELVAQNKLFHDQEELAKKQVKAEKDAADAKKRVDREEADREKQAAQRRKAAIADAKEMARTIAGTAADIAKWATIGGGAAMAAGALSFWGLDKFVSGVGEERRLSQGLGVSYGERQGMGLAMGRYFDVNSVLGNVADAQADPSKWATFTQFGVNPNGKDPAQLTAEMAIAARRIFLQGNQRLDYAHAHGLDNIFSAEDLRRLARTPEADLRKSGSQALAFSGVADASAKKWQDFIINLDTAGLKLKNELVDRLTVLEAPLSNVIDSFTDLAMKVLTKTNLDMMADGIETFAKYIGSPKFKDDFGHFVDDVGDMASALEDWLKRLGFIHDKATPDQQTAARIDQDQNQVAAYRADIARQQKLLADSNQPVGWHLIHGGIGPYDAGFSAYQAGLSRKIAADARGIAGTEADIAGVQAQVAGRAALGGADGTSASDAGRASSPAPSDMNRLAGIGAGLETDLGLPGKGGAILSSLYQESGVRGIPENASLMREAGQLVPDLGWAQWSAPRGQTTGGRRGMFLAWSAAHHLDWHSDEANKGFLEWDLKTNYPGLLERMRHETSEGAAQDFFQTYEAGGSSKLMKYQGGHTRNAGRIQASINIHNATGNGVAASVNGLASGN